MKKRCAALALAAGVVLSGCASFSGFWDSRIEGTWKRTEGCLDVPDGDPPFENAEILTFEKKRAPGVGKPFEGTFIVETVSEDGTVSQVEWVYRMTDDTLTLARANDGSGVGEGYGFPYQLEENKLTIGSGDDSAVYTKSA